MKLTGDSLVVGIVGGIVAGFSLGLGFYLAQKVVQSRALGKAESKLEDVASRVMPTRTNGEDYIAQAASEFSGYHGANYPTQGKALNDFNFSSQTKNFDFTTGQYI